MTPIVEGTILPITYEDRDIIPFKVTSIITEGKTATNRGVMKVRGVFSESDKKNGNGNIYPRKVWETSLNDSVFKYNLTHRKLLGECEHPVDGKTHPLRAAVLVTSVTMNESGVVEGEYIVLNTPSGDVVRELHEKDVELGVSSRGAGSKVVTKEGNVIQEDYRVKTWDVVLDPSVIIALPKPVQESLAPLLEIMHKESDCKCGTNKGHCGKCANKVENVVNKSNSNQPEEVLVKEKLNTIRTQLNSISERDLSKLSPRELITAESSLFDMRTELASIRKTAPEYEAIIATIDTDAHKLCESVRKAITKSTEQNPPSTTLEALQKKYDTAVLVIEELRKRIKTNPVEGLQEKYDTAVKVIENLRDIINDKVGDNTNFETVQKESSILTKKCEQYIGIIEELRKRVVIPQQESLKTYKETAIAKFPGSKRPHVEALLVSCTKKEEVDKVVESISILAGNPVNYPSHLPPVGGVRSSNVSESTSHQQTPAAKPVDVRNTMVESKDPMVAMTGKILKAAGLR